jgi:hypothetical protein
MQTKRDYALLIEWSWISSNSKYVTQFMNAPRQSVWWKQISIAARFAKRIASIDIYYFILNMPHRPYKTEYIIQNH